MPIRLPAPVVILARLAALIACSVLTSCSHDPPFRNEQFLLSAGEVHQCIMDARDGDSYAAFKLWRHFAFGYGYEEIAKVWEKQAKQAGYIRSHDPSSGPPQPILQIGD